MASTHGYNVLIASASIAASGSASGSGNNSTGYGALIAGAITNGPTGPTTQAIAYVETSGNNADWEFLSMTLGGVNANVVTPISCRIPPEAAYYRVRITGHTGQAVTGRASAQTLPTI